MISSARRQAWQRAAAFCVTTRLQGLCRAGVFARRMGFAALLGLRDDASIVPYGRGARWRRCRMPKNLRHRPLRMRGKALPGFEGYLRGKAAMHPSACVAGTSPYRGGFWRAAFPVGR